MKKLCSQPDCFGEVVIDEFTERRADGTVHPLALKCNGCTTSQDIKKLKAFRKRRRQAERKHHEKVI